MHRHRAKKTTDRGYSAPVSTYNQNPSAHGNICEIARCSCGAVRYRNINQNHIESSGWLELDSEEDYA